MLWTHLLLALAVALLLSVLFVPVLGWRRTDRDAGALLFFFFLVFVMTWAGGLWITPFGPTDWNVTWIPFLAIGFLVAILLAAAAPPVRRRTMARVPEDDPRIAEEAVFNGFF